jgi:hypothetical protein
VDRRLPRLPVSLKLGLDAQQASHVAAILRPDPVYRSNGMARDHRRLGIMLKRVAILGFSAAMMIAANPPGAAKAAEGPKYLECYGSHCYPRYSRYRWHSEYTRYRSEPLHIHSETPHYYYHYSDYYPQYRYRYYDEPRDAYVRYDPYDGGYYRYYSASRYDDSYRYYGYDW